MERINKLDKMWCMNHEGIGQDSVNFISDLTPMIRFFVS